MGFVIQCSVSCGEGQQTRRVLCRDARGDPSTKCEPDRKPPSTQPCRTGIDCPREKHELDDELSEGQSLIIFAKIWFRNAKLECKKYNINVCNLKSNKQKSSEKLEILYNLFSLNFGPLHLD